LILYRYYIPFKNIPPGNSDKIIAEVNINDRSIENRFNRFPNLKRRNICVEVMELRPKRVEYISDQHFLPKAM